MQPGSFDPEALKNTKITITQTAQNSSGRKPLSPVAPLLPTAAERPPRWRMLLV